VGMQGEASDARANEVLCLVAKKVQEEESEGDDRQGPLVSGYGEGDSGGAS
jgi:hypothetical protein